MEAYHDTPHISTRALRDAWIDLLGRWQWEWFTTQTFRQETHPEAADKRFRVWVSKINRELYGTRWYKKHAGVPWVRALEYQRRGVIHFHALFAGVHDLRRLSWMDEWDRLAGFARIEPIHNKDAVNAYVSKYVIKGEANIDLGGALHEASRPLLFWRRHTVSEPGATEAGPGYRTPTPAASRPH